MKREPICKIMYSDMIYRQIGGMFILYLASRTHEVVARKMFTLKLVFVFSEIFLIKLKTKGYTMNSR